MNQAEHGSLLKALYKWCPHNPFSKQSSLIFLISQCNQVQGVRISSLARVPYPDKIPRELTLATASLVQFKVRRGRIRTGPSFILIWPWPFSDPSVQGWLRVSRKVHPTYSGSAGVRMPRRALGLHVHPSWMWPPLPLPPRLTRAAWLRPGLWWGGIRAQSWRMVSEPFLQKHAVFHPRQFSNMAWLVFQAPWVQPAVCATWLPGAWTAAKSCAAAEATTPPTSPGRPSASVSSTGAVPCAARTAWRPWTCTRARPRRAPTGRLRHDPRGGYHPSSLPQGLHWICKDAGPLGSLWEILPEAQKPLPPPWGPRTGATCCTLNLPIFSDFWHLGTCLFLVTTGR